MLSLHTTAFSWLMSLFSLRTWWFSVLIAGLWVSAQGQMARGGVMTPFPVLYRQQQAEQAPPDSLPSRQKQPTDATPKPALDKPSPCDSPSPPPPCQPAATLRREG